MHKIFCLLALITLITEEVQHQIMRRQGKLPQNPTEDPSEKVTADRFDVMRLLELLFFALILSTPAGSPASPQGQLAMILVGLQISRLFGRRVLSQWSVLGVLQTIEILFLIILIVIPFNPGANSGQEVSWDSFLAMAGGILYGILVTLGAAFSISYGIKLLSPDSSTTYNDFPPLADSESWAMRFAVNSVYPGAAGAAGLFLISGLSTVSVVFSLSVLVNLTGLIISRRPDYRGHHPVAHILWGLSFLLVLAMMAFRITSFSSA